MKSYPIVFVLALVFIDTNALDACSDENLLTQNLVNDPVFKQCDGALANYFTTQQGLTRDALRYVIGKTTASSIGSQILVEDQKSGKCIVAVVESVPRSPPRISSVCSLPLPCPSNPAYNKC